MVRSYGRTARTGREVSEFEPLSEYTDFEDVNGTTSPRTRMSSKTLKIACGVAVVLLAVAIVLGVLYGREHGNANANSSRNTIGDQLNLKDNVENFTIGWTMYNPSTSPTIRETQYSSSRASQLPALDVTTITSTATEQRKPSMIESTTNAIIISENSSTLAKATNLPSANSSVDNVTFSTLTDFAKITKTVTDTTTPAMTTKYQSISTATEPSTTTATEPSTTTATEPSTTTGTEPSLTTTTKTSTTTSAKPSLTTTTKVSTTTATESSSTTATESSSTTATESSSTTATESSSTTATESSSSTATESSSTTATKTSITTAESSAIKREPSTMVSDLTLETVTNDSLENDTEDSTFEPTTVPTTPQPTFPAPVTEPQVGQWYIIMSYSYGKVLDVFKGGSVTGSQIGLWPFNNGRNQHFRFNKAPDGNTSYLIESRRSGKQVIYRTSKGFYKGHYSPIQLYDATFSSNEIWNITQIVNRPGLVQIENVTTKKCITPNTAKIIDVHDILTAIYCNSGDDNQFWRIIPICE